MIIYLHLLHAYKNEDGNNESVGNWWDSPSTTVLNFFQSARFLCTLGHNQALQHHH